MPVQLGARADAPDAATGRTPLHAAVGRCRLTPGRPQVDRAWCQRLKLKCVKPLSNFAFNFNLRPYTAAKRYDGILGGEATVDALVRAGPPGYLTAARDSAGRVPLHAAAKSGVRPAGYHPPRHQTHFDPSFLELHEIL